MENSSRKQILVWQKKGAALQTSHVVRPAPAHKVGLAKQLQQIAEQSQQKSNMNASCLGPSIDKEASEKCNDS